MNSGTRRIVTHHFFSGLWIVSALAVLLLSTGGCNQFKRFQDPSRDECEVAFEHVLKVLAREQNPDALIQEAGVSVIDWLAKKTGTKERLVKQCMVKASRFDTACILEAKSSEQLEQCEFMKDWE